MHDFITAQLESILQSTLGIGDIGNATPPPAVSIIGKKASSPAGSSTSALPVEARSRIDGGSVERRDTYPVQRTSTSDIPGGEDK